MSADHTAYTLAIRNAILAATFVTTGSTNLAATSTGFSRASGSFIADGFAPGMEVTGVGFNANNNGARVITQVTAGFLTCAGCTAQSSTAGRTLSVVLPRYRAWDGVRLNTTDHEPITGIPYVVEQYIPGPESKPGITKDSEVEIFPMYSMQFHVPDGYGLGADGGYCKAMKALFTAGSTVAAGSVTLRVRTSPAPFESQRLPGKPGFSVKTITIPFWARVPNATNTL